MNKYYSQIDLNLIDFNWEVLRDELVQEYSTTTNLSYYKLNDESPIYNIFPSDILNIGEPSFKFVEVKGQGILPPHVDYGAKTVLNYYFQPSGSITRFYERKDTATIITDNNARTHLFKYSDLVFADSFTAKSNETFLLNVEQVHEVIHASKLPRQFIQIQWSKMDYFYVLNKLNDFGRVREI